MTGNCDYPFACTKTEATIQDVMFLVSLGTSKYVVKGIIFLFAIAIIGGDLLQQGCKGTTTIIFQRLEEFLDSSDALSDVLCGSLSACTRIDATLSLRVECLVTIHEHVIDLIGKSIIYVFFRRRWWTRRWRWWWRRKLALRKCDCIGISYCFDWKLNVVGQSGWLKHSLVVWEFIHICDCALG
jgi:hypothetical protein